LSTASHYLKKLPSTNTSPDVGGAWLLESINDHATTHAMADKNCARSRDSVFHLIDRSSHDFYGNGLWLRWIAVTGKIERNATEPRRQAPKLLLPVVKGASKSMNKDQGWIVCAENDEIDMVRTIRHVTAPHDLSLTNAEAE
jgi:hypothetical protein